MLSSDMAEARMAGISVQCENAQEGARRRMDGDVIHAGRAH